MQGSPTPESETLPPFTLEIRDEEPFGNGDFTPGAAVQIAAGFRSGDLAREIDAENLVIMFLVLSGVTANGDFVATPELLAPALGVAPAAMLERLRQTAAVRWRGTPLLHESEAPTGMRMFRPTPALYRVSRSTVFTGPSTLSAWQQGRADSGLLVSRDRIIEHNRAAYARPRAEVEAEINAFYGQDEPPATPEEAQRLRLKRRLTAHGLTSDQAEALLAQFNPNRIERQVDWLPHRHARNPAGYLVAAVEGNYGPPLKMPGRLAPPAKPDGQSYGVWENEDFTSGLPEDSLADLNVPHDDLGRNEAESVNLEVPPVPGFPTSGLLGPEHEV